MICLVMDTLLPQTINVQITVEKIDFSGCSFNKETISRPISPSGSDNKVDEDQWAFYYSCLHARVVKNPTYRCSTREENRASFSPALYLPGTIRDGELSEVYSIPVINGSLLLIIYV